MVDRITESGDTRITEDSDTRILEFILQTKTFTNDMIIQAELTKTFTGDMLVQTDLTKTFTNDMIVLNANGLLDSVVIRKIILDTVQIH